MSMIDWTWSFIHLSFICLLFVFYLLFHFFLPNVFRFLFLHSLIQRDNRQKSAADRSYASRVICHLRNMSLAQYATKANALGQRTKAHLSAPMETYEAGIRHGSSACDKRKARCRRTCGICCGNSRHWCIRPFRPPDRPSGPPLNSVLLSRSALCPGKC